MEGEAQIRGIMAQTPQELSRPRAKGADQDDEALKAFIAERITAILRRLAKRGEAVKIGMSRNAQ